MLRRKTTSSLVLREIRESLVRVTENRYSLVVEIGVPLPPQPWSHGRRPYIYAAAGSVPATIIVGKLSTYSKRFDAHARGHLP